MPNKSSGKTSNKKLADYKSEVRLKRLRTSILATLVLVTFAFFIMMVSGDKFNNILSYFGLSGFSYQPGGVYADCSKRENQDNEYCLRENRNIERSWDSISRSGGKPAPFSLNDK